MKRRDAWGGKVAVGITAAGSVPITAFRDPDEAGIAVTVDAREGIVIRAPVDAPKDALLEAARWAVVTARRFAAERRREARDRAAMRGRTDVCELHARLGSWDRTLRAIEDPDRARDIGVGKGRRARRLTDDEHALASRLHDWAPTRVLADDGLPADARVLRRWAKQFRYATDAEQGVDDIAGALADSQP